MKLIPSNELEDLFLMLPKMRLEDEGFSNIQKIELDETERNCLYIMTRILMYHSGFIGTNFVFCEDIFIKKIFYQLGYEVYCDKIMTISRRVK